MVSQGLSLAKTLGKGMDKTFFSSNSSGINAEESP